MVGEMFAGLGAFKTMLDMAKALKDMNDATVRNGAVIELQEKILAAQAAQATLLERVGELETEVARLKAWDAEKQRYELKALPSGSFARALKADAQGSEPPHYICAACYERGKKSILQKKATNVASINLSKPPMYICPECKAEILQ
jgi:Zn finger protein HypA/HybF involved in hydrogenase expression